MRKTKEGRRKKCVYQNNAVIIYFGYNQISFDIKSNFSLLIQTRAIEL